MLLTFHPDVDAAITERVYGTSGPSWWVISVAPHGSSSNVRSIGKRRTSRDKGTPPDLPEEPADPPGKSQGAPLSRPSIEPTENTVFANPLRARNGFAVRKKTTFPSGSVEGRDKGTPFGLPEDPESESGAWQTEGRSPVATLYRTNRKHGFLARHARHRFARKPCFLLVL